MTHNMYTRARTHARARAHTHTHTRARAHTRTPPNYPNPPRYHDVVGDSKCPIVDTWWQTETGGHMITPLPNAWLQKPGSATLPFFGVVPAIVDDKNNELEGVAEGMLCIKQGWPSTLRTVYGDHARCVCV